MRFGKPFISWYSSPPNKKRRHCIWKVWIALTNSLPFQTWRVMLPVVYKRWTTVICIAWNYMLDISKKTTVIRLAAVGTTEHCVGMVVVGIKSGELFITLPLQDDWTTTTNSYNMNFPHITNTWERDYGCSATWDTLIIISKTWEEIHVNVWWKPRRETVIALLCSITRALNVRCYERNISSQKHPPLMFTCRKAIKDALYRISGSMSIVFHPINYWMHHFGRRSICCNWVYAW